MTRIEVEIMKKGFTLIELLAVIVILAIIALIATPIVLNIINDTKESSLLRSAEFYLDAVEQSITHLNASGGNFNPKSCEIEENGNIICDRNKDNIIELKLDGEKPDSGFITIENGKINKVELYYKDKLIINKESERLEYSPVIFVKVEDSNPGIICGETSKEDLNKEICYIKSIEDLVELSTLVNKGTTFENKKVELVYSLDFNSRRSYASKQVNETLITGEGFTPIGSNSSKAFKGTFEGNNNIVKGLYINRPETSNIGLFGYSDGISISNLNIEDVNLIGRATIGALVAENKSTIIENITLKNIYLKSKGGEYDNIGGMLGSNTSSKISNIIVSDISIDSGGPAGGLIGRNTGQLVENITIENIYIKNIGYYNVGGLIGSDSTSVIKNIVGNDIKIIAKARYVGGLSGGIIGNIFQIKLTNIYIEGNNYVGGLSGHGGGNSNITNCKISGNVKGGNLVGLIFGMSYSQSINSIVVAGSAVGGEIFNGFVGHNYWDTSSFQYISAVNLSQNIIAHFNDVKNLDTMGKTSQSEYEKLGFNFDDTSKSYWYFNENDELDLMIERN